MESVTAFAPATVSNVACGFDVLGFALDTPGDEVTARFAPAGVTIDEIVGDAGRLPRDAARNTAGVAAQSLLTRLGERRGVALTIHKGLPLSSGLGGSAASAVAWSPLSIAARSSSWRRTPDWRFPSDSRPRFTLMTSCIWFIRFS